MLRIVTLYSWRDFSKRISWIGSQEREKITVTMVTSFTTLFLFLMEYLLTLPPRDCKNILLVSKTWDFAVLKLVDYLDWSICIEFT